MSDTHIHLEHCRACRARVQAFDADYDSFPSEVPTWTQLVALGQRHPATEPVPDIRPPSAAADGARPSATIAPRGSSRRPIAAALGLAAAAALALLIVRKDSDREDEFGLPTLASEDRRAHMPDDSLIRRKGAPSLSMYVLRAGRTFEADLQTQLCAGDRLRFSYAVQEDGYFAILNRDGAGATSSFYSSGMSMAKSSGFKRHLIDESVELDTTPGVEEIYAVYCSKDHEMTQLLRAVSQRPRMPNFPPDCQASQWSFSKEGDVRSCGDR